ncbi:MAG TPA: hypothetical protein VG943_06455 [Caulobacterales bacterium]|nr:hypothetical protein [Caulobacterales bacterium]
MPKLSKISPFLVGFAALLLAALTMPVGKPGQFTASAPSLVVANQQINASYIAPLGVRRRYVDAPLTSFVHDGVRYWINSNSQQTALYRGGLDHPFQHLLWARPTPQVISDPTRSGGRFWITNLYQDPSGLLAFIHTEYGHMQGRTYKTGRGRVGLAWSADGQHFAYLGHILSPSGDPAEYNVQGVPYLIRGGYFYVYYKDQCERGNNAVARAPLNEVIAAARDGRLTPWRKYYHGDWASAGLGGACSAIRLADGIIHTDAAYSTYTHRYYLLTSRMNWRGGDTWIRLNESSDGVNWAPLGDIVRQPAAAVRTGYQYVSIVDVSGRDDAQVGRQFYVYSAKDLQTDVGAVYRWTIDLGSPPQRPPVG